MIRGLDHFIGAILLAFLCAPLSAEDPGEWEWERIAAENGSFSIEVPCTQEGVQTDLRGLFAARSMKLDEGAHVVCIRSGVVLIAGQRSENAPEGERTNVLDQIIADTEGPGKDGVEKTIGEVDGRRALFSREASSDNIARTAIVEMGPSSLLMIVAGGPMEEGVAVEDVDAILNRYVASLEVAQ